MLKIFNLVGLNKFINRFFLFESMKVLERDKENVKKEAERILSNFSKALEKVKTKEKKESLKIGGFREETEGIKGNETFRKIMFENAPLHNEDNILTEKKTW